MDKKEAYRMLDSSSCGLEETCIGIRKMHRDLTEKEIEYIEEALEEITEAINFVKDNKCYSN